MMHYFGTDSASDDTASTNLDLTLSEIATSIFPVLIGIVVMGIIAVLMLL